MSTETERYDPPNPDDPICVCHRRQSMHAPDGGCSRFVPVDSPDAEATWLRAHGLDAAVSAAHDARRAAAAAAVDGEAT
jgi:hypothetical protein